MASSTAALSKPGIMKQTHAPSGDATVSKPGIMKRTHAVTGDAKKVSPAKSARSDKSRSCPYLDTINRSVLDFDFEKLCSVSLSHINVYACMVCGKYFQGRGNNTHAYTHSVFEGHHVFLNLQTHQFYCLPDNYQVIDSSLDDIIIVFFKSILPKRKFKEFLTTISK